MKSQKKNDSSIAQSEREDDNVKNPELENEKETNNAGNRSASRKGKGKKEKVGSNEHSGKSMR
jgi:hypothetical protein